MRTNWVIGMATAAGIVAGVLWGEIAVSGQEATPSAPDLQVAQREIDQKIEVLQRQKEASSVRRNNRKSSRTCRTRPVSARRAWPAS